MKAFRYKRLNENLISATLIDLGVFRAPAFMKRFYVESFWFTIGYGKDGDLHTFDLGVFHLSFFRFGKGFPAVPPWGWFLWNVD